MIERKAKGEEVMEPVSEAPKPTKAPDLMAALEESLAAVKSEPLAGDAKNKSSKASGTRKTTKAKSSSSNGKAATSRKKSSGASRSRAKSGAKSK
jgi:non-homologous end joining protein Ku